MQNSKQKDFLKIFLRITLTVLDCITVKTTFSPGFQISSLTSFKSLEERSFGTCFLVYFKPHFHFCFKFSICLCFFKGFLHALPVRALNVPLKTTKQQSCCCHCCLIFLGGQSHTNLLLSPECCIL